jgi:shikimate dehydrogenase
MPADTAARDPRAAVVRSGLIGRDIGASLSPLLHEGEARAQGWRLEYPRFDFTALGWADDRLGACLADLRQRGFAGCNVTYPFKQAVIGLLDDLSDDAALLGAVNTVVLRQGRAIGHNTDLAGFRSSWLAQFGQAVPRRVLQLGAGGAGAAVAVALAQLGAGQILLHDPDAARAEVLAKRINQRFGAGRAAAVVAERALLATCDALVNASPVGMEAQPGSPLPLDWLHDRLLVADVIYFPLETALVCHARRLGCRAMGGAGMVVAQAAAAFSLITGHPADADRMQASFARAAGLAPA